MGNHIGYQFEIILRANYKAPPTQSAIESRSAMHYHPMKIFMAKKITEERLKLNGHVKRRDTDGPVPGKRRGRLKTRWKDSRIYKRYGKCQVIGGGGGRIVQDRVEDYPR